MKQKLKKYYGAFWFILSTLILIVFFRKNYAYISMCWTPDSFQLLLCLFVVLLIPINVACEVLKMKSVFQEECSFRNCTRLTCQGMLMNLIIPLGFGTMAGRSLYAQGLNRIKNLESCLLMSFLQTLCNIIAGVLIGLPYVLNSGLIQSSLFKLSLMSCLIILGAIILLFVSRKYFIHSKMINLKFKEKLISLRSTVSSSVLWELSVLSVLRYVVYLTQLSLFVYCFTNASWFLVLMSCAYYLLLISLIYAPGIFSFVGRTGFALMAFMPLGLNAEQAVFCALFIFLLNNGLPALLGGYYLFNNANKLAS